MTAPCGASAAMPQCPRHAHDHLAYATQNGCVPRWGIVPSKTHGSVEPDVPLTPWCRVHWGRSIRPKASTTAQRGNPWDNACVSGGKRLCKGVLTYPRECPLGAFVVGMERLLLHPLGWRGSGRLGGVLGRFRAQISIKLIEFVISEMEP